MKIRIKNPIYGVPITFINNYCPKQFEILGIACGNSRKNKFGICANYIENKIDRGGCPVLNNKRNYTRLLIKKKNES